LNIWDLQQNYSYNGLEQLSIGTFVAMNLLAPTNQLRSGRNQLPSLVTNSLLLVPVGHFYDFSFLNQSDLEPLLQ